MRPKVKKLGPMCVQTRNAAGELEIAPMPAFTVGGPVRTPPPRLSAPVDVPADVPVPRPAVEEPAAAPAAEAQPAAEPRSSPAPQLPAAAPAEGSAAAELGLKDARWDSVSGVAPVRGVPAPATVPAPSVIAQAADAPQGQPPAASSSPASATARDFTTQLGVGTSPEAAAAALAAAAEPPSELSAPAMRRLQAEPSTGAGAQPPAGELSSMQRDEAGMSSPSHVAGRLAAATTGELAVDTPAVPELFPVAAPASISSSQPGQADISIPGSGPQADTSAGFCPEAMPMTSQPSALCVGSDPSLPAVSSRDSIDGQPVAPDHADGAFGHGSIRGSETAAVTAQRAAFEAALGMALEPDSDSLAAIQLNRAAITGGLAQPPAAAAVAQQLGAEQVSQQPAMGASLAPVSDPVAMFLNDGPDT